jgi:hypothetical protein
MLEQCLESGYNYILSHPSEFTEHHYRTLNTDLAAVINNYEHQKTLGFHGNIADLLLMYIVIKKL